MRSSQRDGSRRAFSNSARATIKKVDDTKKLQTVEIEVNYLEGAQDVERFQQYGITSVPLPEEGRKAAEAVVLYMGGERSHPVIIAIDDRRYRMKNLKGGEVAIYDDQGQYVKIGRDRIEVISPNKGVLVKSTKKIKVRREKISITMGDDKIFLGKEDVTHAVVTLDGPSKKVFAAIDEDEASD